MFCRFCGKEITDDSKFCSFCGKSSLLPQAEESFEKEESSEAPIEKSAPPEYEAPFVQPKRRRLPIWLTAVILCGGLLIIAVILWLVLANSDKEASIAEESPLPSESSSTPLPSSGAEEGLPSSGTEVSLPLSTTRVLLGPFQKPTKSST
ncbi:MAG: zinc ribbon domain-containing protein [Clostridia bacterium]|nr:zinc ribbon domain-containing protein [Clostridia bacterium]